MTQKNDGKEEKGALRVDQNQLMFKQGFSFSGYERDPLYLNLGSEGKKKFMDVSGVSGIDSITDGRAGVFADFDNDGDTDVFMTTIQGQAHLLFRNNVGARNNWLRIALEGDKKIGRDAFGSVVRVKTSAGTETKIKDGGSGFISQHDARLLFGLGKDARAESIEVTWSNGEVERFDAREAKAGNFLLLRKGANEIAHVESNSRWQKIAFQQTSSASLKRAEVVKIGRANLPDPLTKAETFAHGLKISVGQPMPEIKVKTIDGKSVSLREKLKAKPRTLVNVWATWCVPCAQEMPELERLRAGFARNDLDLVGLNVDTEPDAPLAQFLKDNPVTYRIIAGGIPAAQTLYATDELSVPMSFIVDDKGIVQEIIPGWSNATRRRFESLAGENHRAPRR